MADGIYVDVKTGTWGRMEDLIFVSEKVGKKLEELDSDSEIVATATAGYYQDLEELKDSAYEAGCNDPGYSQN